MIAAVLVLAAGSLGAFRARDGTRLLIGIAAWCVARAAVTTFWRDPDVAGPLPTGGLLALVIAAAAIAGALVLGVWLRHGAGPCRARPQLTPPWPDPETRPPF